MSQQYPQDPNQPRFDSQGFPIKPKGKHTGRNILLAVVGVFVVLIVIGALAGSPPEDATDQPAATVTETPDTGPSPDPVITPTNKPVPTPTLAPAPAVACADQEDRNAPCVVKAGKPFQLGKHTVLAGWKVIDAGYGMSISGKAKNTSDETSSMFITVKFLKGDEVLADVMCNTSELEPGQTATMNCLGGGEYTKKYDRITAEAAF